MSSTFSVIYTALRGMQAQQKSLQTSAHNVANANTPGFTRQQAVLTTTLPLPVPSLNRPGGAGQYGTGVEVEEVRRIRSEFLDMQLRREMGVLGEWEERAEVLERVEVMFMEPSESGLSNLLNQFWTGWQELSKYAESEPIRTTVLETSKALTEAVRHLYGQMQNAVLDLDQSLEIKVGEIGTGETGNLGFQIATLNRKIAAIKLSGDQPNDLMDQRDLLLDQLAKYTAFDRIQNPDGTVKIEVSGRTFVDKREFFQWELSPDGEVVWSEDQTPVEIQSGELCGIIKVRDQVQAYMNELDDFVNSLIKAVNDLHIEGFDLDGAPGEDFFKGSGAADFEVAISDVRLIAAAGPAGENIEDSGDGTQALKIAQIRDNEKLDDNYKNMVARLGVETHEACRMRENQQVMVEQLSSSRDVTGGVSLDEETAHTIQYLHAYNASAMVMSVLDEMLDTLINRIF